MNVVDSSGWLEYLADGPNADFFARPLARADKLVVPSISIYEVFKKVLQQRDEGAALDAAALMQQGKVIELDSSLSMTAAAISIEYKLPMADAVILATAWENDATLWTQDSDFEGIKGVKYSGK